MAAGAEDAFREFHAAWFPRLFRYVFVLMRGDEATAQDVTQEALMRIVRHVRRFDDEAAFWDWLTCLARSAAADHGRKVSRYRRLLENFSGSFSPAPPDADVDLPLAIQHGFAELDESHRNLLNEKYSAGASVRDMAERMGLTESAIESRLARARHCLRKNVFRHLRHET